MPFIKGHTKAVNRIDPHSQDVLSIIIGSLLGDAYADRRFGNTRISFHQEQSNADYCY
jgi:hypothetical protein